MVDQHLENVKAPEVLEIRLAIEQKWRHAVDFDHALAAHHHARMQDFADAPIIEPLFHPHVVRPEAVVLVHHEAHPLAHVGDQFFRFLHRRRERLLAAHVESGIGCQPRERAWLPTGVTMSTASSFSYPIIARKSV